MKRKEFTQEELDLLKHDYTVLKMSKRALSNKYHTSYNRIKEILSFLNLDLGKVYEDDKKGGRKRLYDFNDNFFEKIDTEEKAYWLGFYYADGYVIDSNKIGLSISSVDEKHLEKLIHCIEGDTRNIKRYEGNTNFGLTKYSRVILTSDKMYKDLVSKGVTPNKTNTINDSFIKTLDTEYIKPFIRGYIDGDGSISGLKKKTYAVKICGTENILRFIENSLPINKKIRKLEKRKEGQTVSQLSLGGRKQVVSILEYLYGDANIYLDRKYEKAKLVLSELIK